MRARRAASVGAVFALAALLATGACGGERRAPEVRRELPPPADASALDAATLVRPGAEERALDVAFFEGRTRLEAAACARLFIVAVRGDVTIADEVLKPGDVMVVQHPNALEASTDGLAVRAVQSLPCVALSKPAPVVTLRRAADARELTWARGTMHARLDVGPDVSPELYLGRLSGAAAVAEHRHDTSTEILVAIEAAGTFTIDGAPHRLGPRQIVTVPKGTRHSWTPDPGSNLVAIQLYDPPGPEQRFVSLDAAERAALDGGARP